MPSATLDGGAGNRTILDLNSSTHDCRHLTAHASNATAAQQRAQTSRKPAGVVRFNLAKQRYARQLSGGCVRERRRLQRVESGRPVAALTKMPHNIHIHLTGYSGLRPVPPAGDAGRYSEAGRVDGATQCIY
jgi:hypothetical protein